jgi:hypothetical protein
VQEREELVIIMIQFILSYAVSCSSSNCIRLTSIRLTSKRLTHLVQEREELPGTIGINPHVVNLHPGDALIILSVACYEALLALLHAPSVQGTDTLLVQIILIIVRVLKKSKLDGRVIGVHTPAYDALGIDSRRDCGKLVISAEQIRWMLQS